jgi:hypothetical protein
MPWAHGELRWKTARCVSEPTINRFGIASIATYSMAQHVSYRSQDGRRQ